jgi:transposase
MGLSRCKLSNKQQKELVRFFIAETTARTAADLTGLHRNTVALFYHKLRLLVVERIADEEPFDGEIELDESYYGGVRKGKRGRGAAGKTPVFGLLKRGGKVYAAMVEDTKSKTLMPVIRSKIKPHSVVYTDSYRSYNVLDVSEFGHFRINHSECFVDHKNHINGIENFWNQSKRVLRKYNGIPKKNFNLFLQECVFRFNYGSPAAQLKTLNRWANIS